ncbi:MAG TPA: MerR family transcriptional regulator, partial [Myxococcales bacterium]|nr:MerR family transcriptional regulator [Myxococcales bacterium]
MAQREGDEFDALEAQYVAGISAGQIVEFFAPRGVKLAQATFRKYVQLGLLPRSRRVGEKGKHRGSRGLYPAAAVRRIHLIKSLMDEGMTLEDIRRSFVFFKNHIDQVERGLDEVLGEFLLELDDRPFGRERKRELTAQLERLRARARELVKDVARIGSAVTARPPR